MNQTINRLLDVLSDYFAHRKGLLVFVGIGLVVINLVLQFFPGLGWLVSSQLFLSLGVLVSLLGILLAWSL
jgi:hypothetical protein